MTETARPAVVLLSGGVDSTTTLAVAARQGFELNALTFRYGQRHEIEVEAARRVARTFRVARHEIVTLDLRRFGGSALTGDIAVPKDRAPDEIARGIPVTYVPARNTIFLSYALAWAEVLGSDDVFIGVNALDYSGYPDCRPEFLEAFQQVIWTGTRSGVEHREPRIVAPLAMLSKADIIRRGLALGVDYAITHSCYDPDEGGRACGGCDSCRLRREGFREAGVRDPTTYVEG